MHSFSFSIQKFLFFNTKIIIFTRERRVLVAPKSYIISITKSIIFNTEFLIVKCKPERCTGQASGCTPGTAPLLRDLMALEPLEPEPEPEPEPEQEQEQEQERSVQPSPAPRPGPRGQRRLAGRFCMS